MTFVILSLPIVSCIPKYPLASGLRCSHICFVYSVELSARFYGFMVHNVIYCEYNKALWN